MKHQLFGVVSVVLAMVSPFALMISAIAIDGAPGDVNSLGIFGPGTELTCEWVSADGQQAVFSSPNGWRRLVDISNQHVPLEVGRHYIRQHTAVAKFVQQVWLRAEGN